MNRSSLLSKLTLTLAAAGLFTTAGVAAQDPSASLPTRLELFGASTTVDQTWELRNSDGQRGTVSLLTESLVDADGTDVGTHTWDCIRSEAAGWYCTGWLQLKSGAHTRDGTLVLMGIFTGFTGEPFVIVGGTGGYAGASGTGVFEVQEDRFVRTLLLEP